MIPATNRSFRLALFGGLLLCASTAFAADVNRPVVSRVSPIYPELAKRMHVSGVVVLRVTVQPDGTVSQTTAASGHALLVTAAQEAVRKWRFVPSSESTESTIDINFSEAGN
jgi:TonB family protein